MSMYEWAKKEVELACERERANEEGSDAEYGVRCYKNALEAYKVLCDQGHSGTSISLTRQTLNRLISNKPLTPIEEYGNWNYLSKTDISENVIKETYQNKRYGLPFSV